MKRKKKGGPLLVTLDAREADRVRELIDKRGADKAARAVGLCDTTTLYKAVALLPCSPLTIGTIRLHLGRGL